MTEPRRLPLDVRLRAEARRYLVEGILWSVYEDPDPEPPRYGPALIFESMFSARRVRNYPANWRERTDLQLHALSDCA